MRIGIDARMSGLKHAGIGRYVESLLGELQKQETKNQYLVFGSKKDLSFLWAKNFQVVEAKIPHYSLKEQLLFPFLLSKKKVDLMHFPHFNVPFFYSGQFVVTIHDLIKHHSKGAETTTRASFVYWLKYLAYRIIFWRTVKKAAKILVPSQFVKDELVQAYGLSPAKVVVTYEGVGEKLQTKKSLTKRQKAKILEHYQVKSPFLLYVGSVYPHKNIERLIKAVLSLKTNLVIVCGRSVFWERLRKKIKELGAGDRVVLAGFVPDEDLAAFYQEAQAFVFPSLSEGFGLPGLEAMSQGALVLASDIPVFREVYGQAAAYFNPFSAQQMVETIKKVTQDSKQKQKLIKKAESQVKKYSWTNMAKETLAVYNQALNEQV